MARLSISAAARAVRKDRGTIHRYIKSGKLSVAKDAAGSPVIETAELLRVFGELKGDGSKEKQGKSVAMDVENSSLHHTLETTLELLKQQLKASQEREARLLQMLEQEQGSRRDLERRLLPPGESNVGHSAIVREREIPADEPGESLFQGMDIPVPAASHRAEYTETATSGNRLHMQGQAVSTSMQSESRPVAAVSIVQNSVKEAVEKRSFFARLFSW